MRMLGSHVGLHFWPCLHILNKNRPVDAFVQFLNLYRVKQSQKRPLNACVMFLTVKKSPLPLAYLLLSGTGCTG